MEKERRLAEEWEVGTLFLRPPKEPLQFGAIRHEVFVKTIHRGQEWLVLQKDCAPSSCFKPEPEPAEPDALKVGERVYVACPRVPGREFGISGYGAIAKIWRPTEVPAPRAAICVRPDEAWTLTGDACSSVGTEAWTVYAAACNREGPQSEPPEGGVFLGRFDIPGVGVRDFWWSHGCVFRHVAWDGREWFNKFSPTCIEQDGDGHGLVARDLRPVYRAALAVARAKGLVEAEPEQAPEPKQPRTVPRYMVGQKVEAGGKTGTVSNCYWHPVDREYWYATKEQCDTSPMYNERAVSPHTMTIADVPDDTLLAIVRGRPMRVVDAPVTHEGLPYSEKHGSVEADWCLRGQHVAVRELAAINDARGHSLVVLPDARSLWPWNLELVTEADT